MTDNIIAIGDGTERKSTMIGHSQPNKNHDDASAIQPSPIDSGSDTIRTDVSRDADETEFGVSTTSAGTKSGKGGSDADIPKQSPHLKAQQSGLDSWWARAATSQEACDATHRSFDSAADKDIGAGPSAGAVAAAEDDCVTIDSTDGSTERPSLLKGKYNIPSVDRLNIHEDDRSWIKTVILIRNDMRNYFGLAFANRCGFFSDYHMSTLVHRYSFWLDYPSGYHKIPERDSMMKFIAVSTDGYHLYTAGNTDLLKWNFVKHNLLKSWKESECSLYCLIYHQSGRVISGDEKGIIRVRNSLKNDELIHTLKGHSDLVSSMDVNLNGTLLVSGSEDHTIRLWSLKRGECLRVITAHTHLVTFVHFLDNGEFISTSRDKSIRVWHPYIEECQRMIIDDKLRIRHEPSMNRDASILAFAGYSSLWLYSLPDLQIIQVIFEGIELCEFHPVNPDLLVVYGRFDSIRILNMSSGEITDISDDDIRTNSICFSPDGSRLICADWTNCLQIWDVSDMI